MSVIVTRTEVKPECGSIIVGRTVIIRSSVVIRWCVIRVGIARCNGDWRRRSGCIHVEENALRNPVLMREVSTGSEYPGLDKLIGREREGLDDVIIGAKIMERPVLVAENLQLERRIADGFLVGFDPGARRGSFDQHIVGNRPMRPALNPRGRRGAPG